MVCCVQEKTEEVGDLKLAVAKKELEARKQEEKIDACVLSHHAAPAKALGSSACDVTWMK